MIPTIILNNIDRGLNNNMLIHITMAMNKKTKMYLSK